MIAVSSKKNLCHQTVGSWPLQHRPLMQSYHILKEYTRVEPSRPPKSDEAHNTECATRMLDVRVRACVCHAQRRRGQRSWKEWGGKAQAQKGAEHANHGTS